jgi:indole-3-glycerol phosphate synthase
MLEHIIARKRQRLSLIDQNSRIRSWEKEVGNLPPCRDFKSALAKQMEVSLVAEIKRASPSAGVLRNIVRVCDVTTLYQESGASAISVLTEEEFFRGSIDDLKEARASTGLPILRKDFIVSEYQIWESRFIGADAILLIAAVLISEELNRFLHLAGELGMQALIEVYSQSELEKALRAGSQIIGINNRDLRNFTIDLKTTESLAPLIPRDKIKVSESGILNRQDIVRLQQIGVDAVLVGEAILRSPHPGQKIEELLGRKSKVEATND